MGWYNLFPLQWVQLFRERLSYKTGQCQKVLWVILDGLNFLGNVSLPLFNSPFPSSLVYLFQNESKCETFHLKMSSACSFIFMRINTIFIRMVSQLDPLWNRGTRELGNGLLKLMVFQCDERKSHEHARLWFLLPLLWSIDNFDQAMLSYVPLPIVTFSIITVLGQPFSIQV